jgi:hypothetical protein
MVNRNNMLVVFERAGHLVRNVLRRGRSRRQDDDEPFAIADSCLHRPVPILADRDVELVDPDIHSRGLHVLGKAQRKGLVTARIADEISCHPNRRIFQSPATSR